MAQGTTGREPYRAPQEFSFCEEDQRKHRSHFWRLPKRLAGDPQAPGLLARIWRPDGTSRGGGAASSILPILAFHSFPGMGGAVSESSRWTPWRALPYRRTAMLAGVNKNTVTAGYAHLQDLGLLEAREAPLRGRGALFRSEYRLSRDLFPRGEEPYAVFPASLLFGGGWSVLPTPASRQLYLVTACLDPVGSEEAYLLKIETELPGEDWGEKDSEGEIWDSFDWSRHGEDEYLAYWEAIQGAALAERRAAAAVSLSELSQLSGLSRSVVDTSLGILLTPIFGGQVGEREFPPISLLRRGVEAGNRPTWYAPDRRVMGWNFQPSFLNHSVRVQEYQRDRWPNLKRQSKSTAAA